MIKYNPPFPYTLHNGDCLDVMRAMDANSVDTIVCDPPYALTEPRSGGNGSGVMWAERDESAKARRRGGFMGKQWDAELPSIDIWSEALRVAKPGAMLLAFGGTRTHHRLMVAIEDAGWEIRDVIMWVHSQGFPKSLDISKQLDRQEYVRREKAIKQALAAKGYSDVVWSNDHEVLEVVTLEIDGQTVLVQRLEDGTFRKPDYLAGATREVVGRAHNGAGNKPIAGISGAATDAQRKTVSPVRQREGVESFAEYDITTPATPAATLWQGWGTALKPAYEPVIMAMKPLDGTFAQNAEKWGVAGLNIDGARIASCADDPNTRTNKARHNRVGSIGYAGGFAGYNSPNPHESGGRWPANLILDDEAAEGQEWARYFYCAKASRREREAGLEGMPLRAGGGMQGTQDGTLLTGSGNERNSQMSNHHPTVKPLALMRYLVRLTSTPTGGVVLDPFMGSGTTGVAALQEGRGFVGIELDADYFKIAEKRISNAVAQPALVTA